MNDVIMDFLEYLTDTKNYSAHTVTAYESDIRDFISFYERFTGSTLFVRDMSNIDTMCFRSYLADAQRRGLSAKTVGRSLSSLRSFFKFLTKKYNVQNEAIGLISSPKIPRKISKAIDTIDVENMRGAIRAIDANEPWISARDWALVVLLFCCGLRISEALSLRNCDVASHPDVLRIMGKGSKERLVPVLPIVWDAIDKYVSLRPFGNDKNDELLLVKVHII